jgi:hypothetical protein
MKQKAGHLKGKIKFTNLANLIKMRREKTQINKIGNVKREITKTPRKFRESLWQL